MIIAVNWSLAWRLFALAVVTLTVQIAAVSQVTLLGVSADLTPLLVMSVGLLLGSVPGAVMGFSLGLFLDMALLQTLGVTSLVYTGVGYWCGRLRELRDPAHGLTPLAVGAAATAVGVIGYSLIEFLLGGGALVSFELVTQILATIAVNTILALPFYALVRRLLLPVMPDDPRRRRRRAYTTGGLSPISRT